MSEVARHWPPSRTNCIVVSGPSSPWRTTAVAWVPLTVDVADDEVELVAVLDRLLHLLRAVRAGRLELVDELPREHVRADVLGLVALGRLLQLLDLVGDLTLVGGEPIRVVVGLPGTATNASGARASEATATARRRFMAVRS